VRTLIDNWTTTPAYVHGRSGDVPAANPLAIALSSHFAPGTNTMRAAFLDPEMRVFYRDWDEMTAKAVPYPAGGGRGGHRRSAPRRPHR
jgi:hypothetical protein